MIEFIRLMGLNRVLFLVGLVLYIVVVFAVLLSDSSSSREHIVAEGHDEDEDENEKEDLFSPEDAHYIIESPLSESMSSGTRRKIFRKRSKDDDFWYL